MVNDIIAAHVVGLAYNSHKNIQDEVDIRKSESDLQFQGVQTHMSINLKKVIHSRSCSIRGVCEVCSQPEVCTP